MLRPYNRWYVYLAIALLFGIPMSRGVRALVLKYFWQAYSISSNSMAPTILRGDWIYATGWRGAMKHGDNVVYRSHGVSFVKRVVALGGDMVGMRNDSLFVNGRFVPEPYAIPSGTAAEQHEVEFDWQRRVLAYPVDAANFRPTFATWGPLKVPNHTCFVLGDNRGQSMDSRFIGPVDIDSVVQRPVGIYFSRDTTGAPRWGRVERDVQQ